MAMAELRKLGRSWLIGGTLIAVGAVVGYALPQNTVSPKSEVGMVTSASPAPAGDGTATIVSFTPRGGTRQTLLINDFTPWQGKRRLDRVLRLRFLAASARRASPHRAAAGHSAPRPTPVQVGCGRASAGRRANL